MEPRPGVEVLLTAATPLELDAVVAALAQREQRVVAGRPLVLGRCGGVAVGALVTGIGKANAAMATATALQAVPASWTLSLGIGGVYPGHDLEVGGLAVAQVECYGDEGVQTSTGWEDLETLGIPLWHREGRRWFNRLPVDAAGAEALARAAATVTAVATGPFVTVSTVTGTAAQAARLAARWGGLCETLEGAAVAHAALVAGSRFVEVRGISNRVGPRERETWQLGPAAAAAQRAALAWLDTL